MYEEWGSLAELALRIAFGGGLLLLFTWLLMRWTRQPARQQRLGEWSMAAALILAVLSLGPSWLIICLPAWVNVGGLSSLIPPTPASWETEVAEAGWGSSIAPVHFTTEGDAPRQIVVHLWPTDEEDEESSATISISAGKCDRADCIGLPVEPEATEPSGPEPSYAAFSLGGIVSWLLHPGHLASLMIAAWIAGALLLLGRCLLGYLGLWHLLRHAEPAPDCILHLLAGMTGGKRCPRLRVSSRVRSPLSWGLLRPTIVLPKALCQAADAATLRWVFAHELTHLERRDAWTALLFAVGQTLYFFLPWYWWLRRRVRLCQEYIADAAAVDDQHRPEEYAHFLLTLTTGPAVPVGAMGFFGRSSDLFWRVQMLLRRPMALERRCPRFCSLPIAASLLTLAVIVSGIGLRADSSASTFLMAELVPAPALEPLAANDSEDFMPRAEGELPTAAGESGSSTAAPESSDQPRRTMPRVGMPPWGGFQGFDWPRNGTNRQMGWPRVDPKKSTPQPHLAHGFASPYNTSTLREDERRLGVRLDRPSNSQIDRLGLQKGQGLVVERVQPYSAAARTGIRADDVIVELNGKSISNDYRQFARIMDQVKPRTPVKVVVLRDGQKETIIGLSLPPEFRPTFGFRPPTFGIPYPPRRGSGSGDSPAAEG